MIIVASASLSVTTCATQSLTSIRVNTAARLLKLTVFFQKHFDGYSGDRQTDNNNGKQHNFQNHFSFY